MFTARSRQSGEISEEKALQKTRLADPSDTDADIVASPRTDADIQFSVGNSQRWAVASGACMVAGGDRTGCHSRSYTQSTTKLGMFDSFVESMSRFL